ncbi:MAG TPA: DEAD/DEAH box helicase [Bryobacteraceae bacterium]|nr:DEAD/DEAH box helicase [Bryobacteraceae bacterium]
MSQELLDLQNGSLENGSLAPFVQQLERLAAADADGPIRAIRRTPARPADYGNFPEHMNPKLREVLASRGIDRPYSHQAEAYARIAAGENIVVVTPTASGKTLCYNLPVLDRLTAEPGARALYLFPTKALAEDQLEELHGLIGAMGTDICAFTYDGDTPQDARRAIRQRANVVLTNPDMLHSGILPHHTKWAKLFENLKYIVIDELHYYRGVYGSHLGNIMRRLRRLCEFYGSSPQFIACSATIANPKALAEALLETPFGLVDRNGSPAGEKVFVCYNPPVVNRQLGIRRSYINETRRIALELLDHGQQTLVFANSRLATELLVTYLKDACDKGRIPTESVRGYRGGYLPRERREIEKRLRSGDIRAVVATNALELGIDVGSLDAVVMAGYPGTIASTWQRAGRAGRRQTGSLAIMIASSAPVDQYVVEHPEYLFDRSPEHAFVNPDNIEILLSHVQCAVFELPMRVGEKFGPHDVSELCAYLAESESVHLAGNAWHWMSESYPANTVSLRSVSSDNFVVVDITGEARIIGEVAFTAALTTLHEKAIYLHEAKQFHVERFDYKERKAYVKRVDCDYYTDAIDYTQVRILSEFEKSGVVENADRLHGEARVNRQIVGFKKLRFYTGENVGAGDLSMPEQEMHTTAFWLHFGAKFLQDLAPYAPAERHDGLTGLGNALRTVASLLLMCDPRDLGVALTEDTPGSLVVWEPNLYLYDNFAGGIGLSAPLYRLSDRLFAHTAELIAGCECEAGCPACVGPTGEIGQKGKQVAADILAKLIAASSSAAGPVAGSNS